MTSSNGNRWIPLAKAHDAQVWCFLWCATEQTIKRTAQIPVIWDAMARRLLWGHCNGIIANRVHVAWDIMHGRWLPGVHENLHVCGAPCWPHKPCYRGWVGGGGGYGIWAAKPWYKKRKRIRLFCDISCSPMSHYLSVKVSRNHWKPAKLEIKYVWYYS